MRKLIAVMLAALMLFSVCGCAAEGAVTGPKDLAGKNVGVAEGSAAEKALVRQTHTAMTVFTYLTAEDAALAVTSGEVDCAVADAKTAEDIVKGSQKLKTLGEAYLDEGYSYIAAIENSDLIGDVNEALAALYDDGTLDAIAGHWLGGKSGSAVAQDGEHDFVITLAVTADNRPYSFYDGNGDIVGIDIDTARAVCEYLGFGLEVTAAGADELMDLVRSGKAHLAADCFVKNAEDESLAAFSDVYYTSQQVIIVKK